MVTMASLAAQIALVFWIQPYQQYMPREIGAHIIYNVQFALAIHYLNSCQEIPLTGTNDFRAHVQRVWRSFFASSISLDLATTVSSVVRSVGQPSFLALLLKPTPSLICMTRRCISKLLAKEDVLVI